MKIYLATRSGLVLYYNTTRLLTAQQKDRFAAHQRVS